MVKHLNSIEEQILESLAWTRDSALWTALQASENRVPTCEEVHYLFSSLLKKNCHLLLTATLYRTLFKWESLHRKKDLGQRKAICYLTLVFLISQVIFPNNFEASNGGSGLGHLPMMPISPLVHPRVKEVRTDLGGSLRRGMFEVPHVFWMCDFIYLVLVSVDQGKV